MQRSRSRQPSSRLGATAAGATFTAADLNRLQSRLHQSGAIVSSRSAVSRADTNIDFEVVDVGEGRCATLIEHLLARLEQHGLRRRLVSEDDASAYAVDVAARTDTSETSDDDDSGEANLSEKLSSTASRSSDDRARSSVASSRPLEIREAHYYLCVPCELRLTRISRRSPRWCALEDVHFHFSSATHRATASWMADEDIDETLHSSPFITPLHYYSRIYINGIPTLLSRRPGGGDMFYPLPHEQDLVASMSASLEQRNENLIDPNGFQMTSDSSEASEASNRKLFPSSKLRGAQGGAPALWYRALPSVYTGLVQLIRRTHPSAVTETPSDGRKYRLNRTKSRTMVTVDHCSLDDYRRHSWMPPQMVPLSPAVYGIHRERLPKPLLARLEEATQSGTEMGLPLHRRQVLTADSSHRTVYTQSLIPMAEGMRDHHRQGDDITTAAPVPTTVFEDECYRVALVSAVDRAHQAKLYPFDLSRQVSGHMNSADNASPEMSQPVLTLELLMHHTQATSQSWEPPRGSPVPSTELMPPSAGSGSSHPTGCRSSQSTASSPVSEDSSTPSSSSRIHKRIKREI